MAVTRRMSSGGRACCTFRDATARGVYRERCPDGDPGLILAADLDRVKVGGVGRRPDPFLLIWEVNRQQMNAIRHNVEEEDERVTKVERRPSETFESLFSRFRKRVARDRIMSDVKKHRYFVPKCERRQAARRKAIRRVNVSVNSSRAGSIAGRMLSSDPKPESTEEVQSC